MNTWKVILATLVIFVAGLVTGAMVVWHSSRLFLPAQQRPFNPNRTNAAPSAGGMRLEFLRRMQRDLDLSPEQHQQIDKIIKESQERTRKIMEPVVPQLHEELQRTKEAFRQVLTPQQQERFDQLLKHQPHRPPQRSGAAVTNAPP